MNFERACEILLGRQNLVKKDGLDRVRACLGRLGDPHERIRTVHVTGTNGKGSVCAMFDSVLRASGRKTGLFISPHLISPTERIRIDGKEIGREDFAALFEEVFKAGPDLGFFELLTCMAFLSFERARVDIAVIEVGIGGRLDTTNVLPRPELAVITSVDLDHQDYLGGTIGEIAAQKAGIIKDGGICLAPLLPEEARGPILAEAGRRSAQVRFLAPVFDISSYDWSRGRMRLRHKRTAEETDLALLGPSQASNATLVHEGVSFLGAGGPAITRAHITEGFSGVSWPGRFQVLEKDGAVYVLDGAHNPEAARAFAATFELSPFRDRAPAFVFGILRDKDHLSVLRVLAPYVSRAVFTRPPSDRAADPCALADEFSRLRPDAEIEVQESVEAALLAGASSGMAVVLGSFYLAGAALDMLGGGGKDREKAGSGRTGGSL
ncbi:MAG TPA: folylpolyglutamate synthase/dihydrofolate synthase family protein [Elusimicrobiales bacterium]|nr:folylpolyglutamate synthase/dihydrofolate synthase family protein [Elusimicrobiales bacterium]